MTETKPKHEPNHKGLRIYIDACERFLPDRATQTDIKAYLEEAYSELVFSISDVREIRKQLGIRRLVRLKKAKEAFLKEYSAGFDRYNVDSFFKAAKFRLTNAERSSILRLKRKTLLAVRLGDKELDFIALLSKAANINKSLAIRSLILLGMGSILGSGMPDYLSKLNAALSASPEHTGFVLSVVSSHLTDALHQSKLLRSHVGRADNRVTA